MALEPWQERVVTEKKELDDKLAKLLAYRGGKQFAGLDSIQRELLNRQSSAMLKYSGVLGERIASFKPAPVGAPGAVGPVGAVDEPGPTGPPLES